MKAIIRRLILLATVVIALGAVSSCKKEDPRLANGYFDINAVSTIEVLNYYGSSLGETLLFEGKSMKIGYLVSDYVFIRCKTSSCMYYVNGTMYTSSNKFYPPDSAKR